MTRAFTYNTVRPQALTPGNSHHPCWACQPPERLGKRTDFPFLNPVLGEFIFHKEDRLFCPAGRFVTIHYITNTVCYITLLGTADVAQQMLSGASLFPKDQCNSPPESGDAQCKTEKSGGIQKNNAKSVDWLRARRVASVGLITGPMNTFWYRYLDRVLVPGPVSPPQICKKVIVDILSSPAFDSVFIVTVAMQEGSTFIEGLTEYTQKCRKIFLLNVSVWIPTQTLNFWLVPIRFRVLYVMSVSFVYNCILTYIKHKDSDIHGNSK